MALAAALAADGNRVLVVDANNSHGSGRRGAQPVSEPGLAEVLAGELDWSDVVRAVPLASGDFFAIGRGRMSSGGGESFSSRRFAEFLAEARTAYSFVLIDAPSMARAADALLMSAYSELSLVVLRIKNSRRSLAYEHLARLSATAECALVINAPDATTSEADHSYTAWVTVPRVPARNREVSGVTALSRSEEAS
jgi:Mrp family chromosome partitioning ATPase